MARVGTIRRYGALPERRHDAFLVALLLAVSLSVAFFAIQALLPRLAYLLQLLGPKQSVQLRQMESEPEEFPFVLVDPSLLDEEDNTDQITEAESNLTRQARQTEDHPDLPDAYSYREEGIDEILTAPEGNPGPAVDYMRSEGESAEQPQPAEPGEPAEEQPPPEEAQEAEETQPDEAEPAEPADAETETAEPLEPVEALAPIEPIEPVDPVPPPPSDPSPLPDPEYFDPPVAPETPPEPAEPMPFEPVEEPPEPLEEMPETQAPEAPEPMEAVTEFVDPIVDPVELAMLPPSDDGFLDPETRRLQDLARQSRDYPPPPMQSPVNAPETREFPQMPPQQPQREVVEPQQPAERRDRTGRRRPTFKKIGSDAPSASSPSASGGAPARRNVSTSVKVLDADASMKLLAHRYGPYMEKLARQLQASLWTQAALSPMSYGRGQVKIRFGISPDGTLTYYDTLFPEEDKLVSERLLSERMLREAAPFDPLTPEMAQDSNFQRMTVIVTLY